MKLKDSTAWECRWFDLAVDQDQTDCEVIFDASYADYQGEVHVGFMNNDGQVVVINYSYGSCSGCDPWEDMPEEQAKADLRATIATMSPAEFLRYATMSQIIPNLDQWVSDFTRQYID